MGWSSGTDVMRGIITTIKKHVSNPDTRKKIYGDIVGILESQDWDCFEECLDEDSAYDEIFDSMFPDYHSQMEALYIRHKGE